MYSYMSRSTNTRSPLRQPFSNVQLKKMEEKHQAGYARKKVTKREFGIWESEQKCGDERSEAKFGDF